jgi:hypothetical protein
MDDANQTIEKHDIDGAGRYMRIPANGEIFIF